MLYLHVILNILNKYFRFFFILFISVNDMGSLGTEYVDIGQKNCQDDVLELKML